MTGIAEQKLSEIFSAKDLQTQSSGLERKATFFKGESITKKR